jgi:hypothetical protein
MSRKQPLTRNQLAEFLPNHEAIKAFERIMDEVYNLMPADIVTLTNLANEAYLQGSSAGNQAESVSGILGSLIIWTSLFHRFRLRRPDVFFMMTETALWNWC